MGAGGGGGLEANLARWEKQLAHGSKPERQTLEIADGVKATVMDMTGIYMGSRVPGAKGKDEPDTRMLAAVLECPKGPLYFKLVGPQDEVAGLKAAFLDWLRSFRKAP